MFHQFSTCENLSVSLMVMMCSMRGGSDGTAEFLVLIIFQSDASRIIIPLQRDTKVIFIEK